MKQKCRFCEKEIEYEHWRSFAGHTRSCKAHPRYEELKIKRCKKKKRYKLILKCRKCDKYFEQILTKARIKRKKYNICCSRKCANSHIRTEESKRKTSESVKTYIKKYGQSNQGLVGHKHTEETKKKLSEAAKLSYKKGLIFKICGNAYPRKSEKLWRPRIEKYFNTTGLIPQKIDKHWFDFVNDDYVIEFTLTKDSVGVRNALKRFKTIPNEKRIKILVCYLKCVGKKTKPKILSLNVKIVDTKDIYTPVV